jgi:hypothetical protein
MKEHTRTIDYRDSESVYYMPSEDPDCREYSDERECFRERASFSRSFSEYLFQSTVYQKFYFFQYQFTPVSSRTAKQGPDRLMLSFLQAF